MDGEKYVSYESYGEFADIYERLMSNVPYDSWVNRITKVLRETGIFDGLVVDLACGTGMITRRLAKKGYDMIGIDLSYEMLQKAWDREIEIEKGRHREKILKPWEHEEKKRERKSTKFSNVSEILYLQQDMRTFELFGTVQAIVCCCDSINYIHERAELETVFRLVNNYLDPDGVLILDFHPKRYFAEELGNNTITEINEDMVMIWENEELKDGNHASYLTIFQEDKDGTYSRFDEVHIQRGYTVEEMQEAAENAGLVDIRFYDGYSSRPAQKRSERIVMTAREHGKAQRMQKKSEAAEAEKNKGTGNTEGTGNAETGNVETGNVETGNEGTVKTEEIGKEESGNRKQKKKTEE